MSSVNKDVAVPVDANRLLPGPSLTTKDVSDFKKNPTNFEER